VIVFWIEEPNMKLHSSAKLALAFAAVSVPFVSQALVRRHDVADSQYTTFGNNAAFAGVGSVFATNNGSSGASGTGTLISSRWMLTAAHVTSGFNQVQFTVGGNTYTSTNIFYTPTAWSLTNGFDLALVQFTTDVVGVAPIALYNNTDELSKVGVGVGFGTTGTGTTGGTTFDGLKRAGRNVIDGFANFGGGPNDKILIADFDSGSSADNFSGTATQQDLEFGVDSGDSGGALLIQDGSTFKLAGVTSFKASVDGLNNQDYGDISGWVRVSQHLNWIETTSGVPEPATMTVLALAALAKRRKAKKNS
jgi:hypothetical protein